MDVDTERETYQTSRQGLDTLCQELTTKLSEETQMRLVRIILPNRDSSVFCVVMSYDFGRKLLGYWKAYALGLQIVTNYKILALKLCNLWCLVFCASFT